ncbi:MAG: T9SS type A sorting domain-containing protein, partial [Chitinophagales bacterium]|nr:T9SS type A sorting domain-containing protein [Chitinophagales bacterium]
MKRLLLFWFCVLFSNAFLSAQIIVHLQYPTDSIVIIDPLQYFPNAITANTTFTQPYHGVVTLLPDGKLRYVANSMTEVAYGDAFSFIVYNGFAFDGSNVYIRPNFDDPIPNVPPLDTEYELYVCGDNAYSHYTLLSLGINDVNGDHCNYSLLQGGLHGSVTIHNDCSILQQFFYQPNMNFMGVDTVVFRACESSTTEHYCANVLQIIHVNDCDVLALAAYNDSYYRTFLSNATFTPLENDYADNLPVTITIIAQANLGSVVVNSDNSFTYHAYNANTSIVDQFAYQICDTLGNCSASATVTLTNIPSIWYPSFPIYEIVTISANESVELNLSPSISNCDVSSCVDSLNSLLYYGSIATTSDGKYIYTPFENLTAPQQGVGLQEIIPYNVCSQYYIWSNVISMIFLIFPACINDTTTVNYQTSAFIAVLDNDLATDPFGIASIDMPPQHGTAILDNNHILYQPDSAYVGNDTLQYIACDSYGNCDTATVFITVLPDSVIGIPSFFSNISLSTQLRVYPNPTRELLNIVVAPDQQIQSIMLTDMAGRRLFAPTLSPTVGNRAAVSVQHLPEGMYLVEVQTDVGVGVQ